MGDYQEHYEIPKEIKDQIPDFFYYAFWGELVSIFGPGVIEAESYYPNEDGKTYEPLYGLTYCTSTGGWNEALWATCKKLDLMPVFEYYDKLPWYDSDRFDGEIEVEMYHHMPRDENPANPYYKYLLDHGIRKLKEKENG